MNLLQIKKTVLLIASLMAGFVFGTVLATKAGEVQRDHTLSTGDRGGKVLQRPIEDFLEAQGIAAEGGYLEWGDANLSLAGKGLIAAIDYVGIDDALVASETGKRLGTCISGTIKERTLADGRAEVTIRIDFRNALAVAAAVDITVDPVSVAYVFGHNVFQVLEGARPSLVDGHMTVVLINHAPNAPLPDLLRLGEGSPWGPAEPGQELVSVRIAASGKGFTPEGTPATLKVHQHGVDLNTGEARFFAEEVVIKSR